MIDTASVFDVYYAAHWSFLAEGKAHIVLENLVDDQYFGYVLKIQKCSDYTASLVIDSTEDDNRFAANNIYPWIWQQVTNSKVIHLSSEWCLAVMENIAQFRPPGRLTMSKLKPFGYLERHVSYLPNNNHISTLTVEIKVKCGHKGSSPFIPSHRSIKLSHGRFHLMQLYKLANAQRSQTVTEDKSQLVLPEWGHFDSMSSYNPTDLCSRETSRVKSALNSLFSNPQNNLKISLKGKHVYGWNKSCSESELKEMLSNIQPNDCESVDEIKLVLTSIFSIENTVKKLEQLQCLDLIDVEGADVIFKRLEVLTGSRVQAVEVIRAELLLPLQFNLIEYINGDFSENDNEYPLIYKLKQLRIDDLTNVEDKQLRILEVLRLVETMTTEDCVLLLKLWMIALIAKDAGVVVALDNVNHSEVILDDEGWINVPPTNCSIKVQSGINPGSVILNLNDKKRCYSYSVSVIDVGLKSMKKFWTKNDEEELICKVCTEFLANNPQAKQ